MRLLSFEFRPGLAAVAGCLWLCTSANADMANITFATYPDGTQVPASDVSTSSFSPTSVMGDQFAALGIHFNNTGELLEVSGPPDGQSTSADGWCPAGGYSCLPNNIVLVNSPSGGQSLDTLQMTFDLQQTVVGIDIDNAYLAESASTTVVLKGGTLVGPLTLTLTEPDEIAACSASQSPNQLCGRFDLSAGAGQTFTEIDILPTTAVGAVQACTGTSGPSCGGSLVDNISFATTAVPEPSCFIPLAAGLAGFVVRRRYSLKQMTSARGAASNA